MSQRNQGYQGFNPYGQYGSGADLFAQMPYDAQTDAARNAAFQFAQPQELSPDERTQMALSHLSQFFSRLGAIGGVEQGAVQAQEQEQFQQQMLQQHQQQAMGEMMMQAAQARAQHEAQQEAEARENMQFKRADALSSYMPYLADSAPLGPGEMGPPQPNEDFKRHLIEGGLDGTGLAAFIAAAQQNMPTPEEADTRKALRQDEQWMRHNQVTSSQIAERQANTQANVNARQERNYQRKGGAKAPKQVPAGWVNSWWSSNKMDDKINSDPEAASRMMKAELSSMAKNPGQYPESVKEDLYNRFQENELKLATMRGKMQAR